MTTWLSAETQIAFYQSGIYHRGWVDGITKRLKFKMPAQEGLLVGS